MDRKNVISLANADIYQRENKILSNLSLDITEGELVYIIGKVGTGKTSLIKTFNAELPLIKGIGHVLDYNLSSIKRKEIAALRRKLGVVFQDFRLLTDRTVFENLAFVLKATGWKSKATIKERVNEVLKIVGELDKKEKMPHELSGGEQQRIVIARALLNNPDIILADEPTGNLDPETSDEILGIFLDLNTKGKTVVVATHDYAVIARKPSRTIVCRDGGISDSENKQENIQFNELLDEND